MESKIRLAVLLLVYFLTVYKTTIAFQILPLKGKKTSHVSTKWSIQGERKPNTISNKKISITSMNMNNFGVSNGKQQHKDIVIIGAGLAGLSAALYITQIDPTRRVTIIDKEKFNKETKQSTTVSSFAAAGMLAPQSERLPRGNLLNLCLESRRMYPEFCRTVESLARESGEEGEEYLFSTDTEDDKSNNINENDCNMEPWEVGYVASGGFLAPAFAGDAVATWAPPEESGKAMWLDATQVRELEPHLHQDVIGGWWFPEDASVDARRLTCSLVAACVGAGVEFLSGKNYEVTSLDLVDGECKGLKLKNGRYLNAKSILLGNGAWMRTLLPVPIEPHKGQSLSLQMPSGRPPVLRRVLFAQDTYIVPKADGKIIVGATIEAGSYDGNITPKGMIHVLSHAIQLVPGLADLPIKETWAGLRPTTPDKGPILGKTPWKNLFLAGGYWRNGVLLAPKTGQLLANLICGDNSSSDNDNKEKGDDDEVDGNELLTPSDRVLLDAFNWDRFISKDGGATLAAATRVAAAMHPIHSRSSGAGVAAAVGTELGFYATASSAAEERKKDRLAVFTDEGDDDDSALERAALLGQQDFEGFEAYDFVDDTLETPADDDVIKFAGEEPINGDSQSFSSFNEDEDKNSYVESNLKTIEKDSDIEKVGNNEDNENEIKHFEVEQSTTDNDEDDMASMYDTIQNRKAKVQINLPEESDNNQREKRPDPGFRIYHEHKETGEVREVPPFTPPAEFMGMIDEITPINLNEERKKELKQEESVMSNTESKVEKIAKETTSLDGKNDTSPAADRNDDDEIKSLYDTIQNRKSKTKVNLPEKNEVGKDDNDFGGRPDPGFRIYHTDKKTGKVRMVPPYTTPAEFMAMIEKENTIDDDNVNGIVDSFLNNINKPDTPSTPKIDEGSSDDSKNEDYSEDMLDGYAVIQNANSRPYREDELKLMRESRKKNRLGKSTIDESKIGARRVEDSLGQKNGIKQKEITLPEETSIDTTSSPPPTTTNVSTNDSEGGYNEDMLDGYAVIKNANSRPYREDELKLMRESRKKNRLGQESIDESKIGAKRAKE